MNYYNENDPKTAAWLRELIKQGHIPQGEVDERSIEDVSTTSLIGYNQHHFFAGIGGWSLALRLANWPSNVPVWTGSCPCQPFSQAGKRRGTADERHLWPTWHWLIKQYRPRRIFGEQVAGQDGMAWLETVSTDLESEGYAIGSVVFPACGVGAFHKRERLWFVADATSERHYGGRITRDSNEDEKKTFGSLEVDSTSRRSVALSVADTESNGWNERRPEPNWRGVEWRRCQDGRQRAIKPSVQPLAHGVSGRVGRLRGYGNAIVPQAAAQIISAYMEVRGIA